MRGIIHMLWLWLYDPYTMMALFIAYIFGLLVINLLAARIAPKVAEKITSRLSLHASMLLTALIIVIGSLAAIYVIYYMLYAIGYMIHIETLLFFVAMMNIFTWLLSPWLINLMYGARRDEELQRIVDEVARSAGMKPPKAVVVNGPPNAFAYGNFLSGKYVAVTKGMLGLVDASELRAVIGHELGHHRHRDTVIMLILGIFPSLIYFLGIMLIRFGLWSSVSRLSGRRSSGGSSGLLLVLVGIVAVIISFVIQVLVLAFSRLREYYADAHGAYVAGSRNMQRALAKLHLYYSERDEERMMVDHSKLRTLFIYALTEAVANPFYSHRGGWRIHRSIDRVIEELKRERVNPAVEVFMSHPPIPKRLRFLDKIARREEIIH